MRKLIKLFLNNHTALLVLVSVFVIGGPLVAILTTQLEYYPKISATRLKVTVKCRGATIEEIDNSVIAPFFKEIRSKESIKDITSTAKQGCAILELVLEDKCKIQDVKDGIISAFNVLSHLPPKTEKPQIEEIKEEEHVVNIALYGNCSAEALKATSIELENILLKKKSITRIHRDGDLVSIIKVEMIPDKLIKYGLTSSDIGTTLSQYSTDYSSSSRKDRPFSVGIRPMTSTVSDIRNIPVKISERYKILLKEVANVSRVFENHEDSTCFFNKKPAIVLSIAKNNDFSPFRILRDAKNCVKSYNSIHRNDVDIDIFQNSPKYLYEQLKLIINSLAGSIVFIFLTVGLFLSFKLSILLSLSLLVCMGGALMVFPIVGNTINVYSLFAFTLAMGLIIDDSIVISENILTHKSRGASSLKEAVLSGTTEVLPSVLCATLTSIAAYIPFIFTSSSEGPLYKIIYITIISIMLFSVVEAVILLPAHICYWNIQEKRKKLPKIFIRLAKLYRNIITLILKKKYTSFLFFCIIVYFYIQASSLGLLSSKGRYEANTLCLKVRMQTDSPFFEDRIKPLISKLSKEIDCNINSINKNNSIDLGKNWEYFYYSFDPRTVSYDISYRVGFNKELLAYHEELTKKVGSFLHSQTCLHKISLNERGGNEGNIVLNIVGRNREYLSEYTSKAKKKIENFHWVERVHDNIGTMNNDLVVSLKGKFSQCGTKYENLVRQINTSMESTVYFTKFDEDKNETKIVLSLDTGAKDGIQVQDFLELPVKMNNGINILSNFLNIGVGKNQKSYERVNGLPADKLYIKYNKDIISYPEGVTHIEILADSIRKSLDIYSDLDINVGQDINGKEQLNMKQKQQNLLVITFILFYIILSITLDSLLLPGLIFIILPCAYAGAIIGHKLFAIQLTGRSLFGIISMLGIAVNDGVILLRKIVKRLENRMNKTQIIDTLVLSCMDRLRPILLTTVTTFLGITPFLLQGSNPKNLAIMPLVVSVAFGVLFSTIATLFVLPFLFLIVEHIKSKITWLKKGN